MTTETKQAFSPTKNHSISTLDKNEMNGLVTSTNETLKQQLSEQKAGIRSTFKEIVAYEKIQTQNLQKWKELQEQQAKEQTRLAKYDDIVSTNTTMDIDLDAHGL